MKAVDCANQQNPFPEWTSIELVNTGIETVGADNILQIEDVSSDCWLTVDHPDVERTFGFDGKRMAADTSRYWNEFRFEPSSHSEHKVEWVLQLRG